jgi:hypothetical protein
MKRCNDSFPRCRPTVGVVDADAVTMVVLEPKRLSWLLRGAHEMLHLPASWDLFDPCSLTGWPQAPYQRLGNRRGGCGHQAPRKAPARRCVGI